MFDNVIKSTPAFNFYQLNLSPGHRYEGAGLTSLSLRPANLFFAKLFEGSGIAATLPGVGLFAFNRPHREIREYCLKKALEAPFGTVAFSAVGIRAQIHGERIAVVNNLATILGDKTYRISYKEIKTTLESQKIFTSSLLPLPFYRALKKAMKEAGIVLLPGSDENPMLLKDLPWPFLASVKENPGAFGFTIDNPFEEFLNLTLYQIGSMVVKSEDYRIFLNGSFKIIERNPDENDAVRLINACGIRGIHAPATPSKYNQKIMTQTFKTAFVAAEKGVVVFPAVGMGVWRGDPELYWTAFLDAVLTSNDKFEKICVNPGHAPSASGKYKGSKGEEFQLILNDYLKKHETNNALKAITNLFEAKTDLVQLAHNLKKAFPDKTVSLFNASDPDVTLGYHVGEYVNNLPHTYTTEENYTAMGTNGLCFEEITGVHDSNDRTIQAL